MRLSIIIPMYNAEKYIRRCVTSIYHQGLVLNDFEVIVINDGSTDSSVQIIKNLCQVYTNLILINKENEGQGAARNLGIDMARGNYLFFIDSDDYLLENQILDMLNQVFETIKFIQVLGYCYIIIFLHLHVHIFLREIFSFSRVYVSRQRLCMKMLTFS